MTMVEVRPATLIERLETIAEAFDLRAHVIAERYDDIDDWRTKLELAEARAATVREAIAAILAAAQGEPHD